VASKAGFEPMRQDAERGGTVVGDVIVGVDGKPVEDQDDLLDLMQDHAPGDEVAVDLERSGARRTIRVKLQALSTR
jgi:S1-C subfamily serine protease